MNGDKCKYADHLVEILRAGGLDGEMSDHVRHCPECREIFNIHGMLMEIAQNSPHVENSSPPPFESLWQRAFLKEKISPEKIAKAMLPIQIAGMVSRMVFLVAAFFLFILIGPGVLGHLEVSGVIRIFNAGFIQPFVRIFNSSLFVSIPMTMVLLSFLAYFLSILIKPLTRQKLRING